MNKYTYIEFLINNRQISNSLNNLSVDYLTSINTINKKAENKHCFTAIPVEWLRENLSYIIPSHINAEHCIPEDVILAGIKQAKKDELIIMLSEEYNNYNRSLEYKAPYLNLLEAEIREYLANDKSGTPILCFVAKRKGISVDSLVKTISATLTERHAIILNREFLQEDMKAEIDKMDLTMLFNLDVITEIKNRLYNFDIFVQTDNEKVDQVVNKKKK